MTKSYEFRQGYTARDAGKSLDDNQYARHPRSICYREWQRGWKAHRRLSTLLGPAKNDTNRPALPVLA